MGARPPAHPKPWSPKGGILLQAQTGKQLAALCTVPFIMVLGNSMLIPVLPQMRAALHIGKPQAGLAITAFSIPAGIAIALAGYLSDRYGRKAVMVPALALYALGGVVAFLAGWLLGERAFLVLLAGRVIQGIGAAGTAPVAMALAGDIFQSAERAKALGLLEAANGLGKVLSPILGAAMGLLGWYMVFAGYLVLTLPALLAVWLAVREPRRPGRQLPAVGAYFGEVLALFRRKAAPLAACFFAGTAALSILFGILFFLSETLEAKYGLDGLPKGAVLALPVLAMSITSYLTGSRLSQNQRLLRPAVITGLGLGAGASLLIPLLGGARPHRGAGDWVFFAGLVVLGVGTGLVLPALNTLVTSSAAEAKRGMLTAVYSATRFFGVALGPPVYGLLMGAGRALPFYFSAAVLGAGALVALLLLNVRVLLGGRTPAPAAPGEAPPAPAAGAAVIEPWQPPLEAPGPRQPLG